MTNWIGVVWPKKASNELESRNGDKKMIGIKKEYPANSILLNKLTIVVISSIYLLITLCTITRNYLH